MKLLSLLFLLSLSGCAQFSAVHKTSYPQEVAPFVEEYLSDKQYYFGTAEFYKPIKITFAPLSGPQAGKCKNHWSWGEITIDEEHWPKIGYWERFVLVYHELAHCDLDYMFHVPGTILNSSLLYGVNESNINMYVMELFDKDFRFRENEVEESCKH